MEHYLWNKLRNDQIRYSCDNPDSIFHEFYEQNSQIRGPVGINPQDSFLCYPLKYNFSYRIFQILANSKPRNLNYFFTVISMF